MGEYNCQSFQYRFSHNMVFMNFHWNQRKNFIWMTIYIWYSTHKSLNNTYFPMIYLYLECHIKIFQSWKINMKLSYVNKKVTFFIHANVSFHVIDIISCYEGQTSPLWPYSLPWIWKILAFHYFGVRIYVAGSKNDSPFLIIVRIQGRLQPIE